MLSFFSSYIKKISSISILVVALLWVLVLKNVFCHGMFLDGIVYSTLSRNFALENNGFWQLWAQSPDGLIFSSHPPLAFWLQSSFFWLLDDHFWVDRLYSISSLLASFFLVKKIWEELVHDFSEGKHWILLIYLFIPIVSWSFNNNLLENTTNFFTLLSIWFFLLQKNRTQYRFGILAGLSIWAATMTKGPIGLFPLVFPILHYLCFRKQNFSQLIVHSALPFLTLSLAWSLLLGSSSEAQTYFSNYVNIQLIKSVSQAGESVKWYEHFNIILKLFLQLSPLLGLSIFLRLVIKEKSTTKTHKQYGLLFLLIGLSASLPIAISPKQLEFYILPSIIYFVISFVFFHFEALRFLHDYLETKKIISFFGIGCITFTMGWTIYSYGDYYRDQDLLNDVFIVGSIVPPHNKIRASDSTLKKWSYQSYLSRYFYLYIQEYPKTLPFYISKKDEGSPKKYKLIVTKSNFFEIYTNKK